MPRTGVHAVGSRSESVQSERYYPLPLRVLPALPRRWAVLVRAVQRPWRIGTKVVTAAEQVATTAGVLVVVAVLDRAPPLVVEVAAGADAIAKPTVTSYQVPSVLRDAAKPAIPDGVGAAACPGGALDPVPVLSARVAQCQSGVRNGTGSTRMGVAGRALASGVSLPAGAAAAACGGTA